MILGITSLRRQTCQTPIGDAKLPACRRYSLDSSKTVVLGPPRQFKPTLLMLFPFFALIRCLSPTVWWPCTVLRGRVARLWVSFKGGGRPHTLKAPAVFLPLASQVQVTITMTPATTKTSLTIGLMDRHLACAKVSIDVDHKNLERDAIAVNAHHSVGHWTKMGLKPSGPKRIANLATHPRRIYSARLQYSGRTIYTPNLPTTGTNSLQTTSNFCISDPDNVAVSPGAGWETDTGDNFIAHSAYSTPPLCCSYAYASSLSDQESDEDLDAIFDEWIDVAQCDPRQKELQWSVVPGYWHNKS